MAKPDHTQDRPPAANGNHYRTPATGNVPDRFLTVADIPEPKPNKTAIRLRGKWLQQAGFLAQTRVRVRVMPGCLVITVQD